MPTANILSGTWRDEHLFRYNDCMSSEAENHETEAAALEDEIAEVCGISTWPPVGWLL